MIDPRWFEHHPLYRHFARHLVRPAPPVFLFVYGTLMRGESDHYLIARQRFVYEGETLPRFRLYDLGAFPAMVAGGSCTVHGEVYLVDADALERIDQIVGRGMFTRSPLVLARPRRQVHAHMLNARHASGAPSIASGRWRERNASAGR